MTLDTDGDGQVSEAEAAAGSAGTATEVCSSVDLSSMAADTTLAEAVAAATSAQVLRLTDCETGATPPADVLAALTANTAITRVLEQETVGAGEILAVSVNAQSVTIYVRDDESTDETNTTP